MMIVAYLIKSGLCLLLLLAFYKVVLEHFPLHHFKRFYLLGSVVFALSIPLVTITYTVPALPEIAPTGSAFVSQISSQEIQPVREPSRFQTYLPAIMLTLYGVGFLLFGSRFVLNLVRLKRKLDAAEVIETSSFNLALLPQLVVPHSFMRTIFLSRKPYYNNKIPSEVIDHEATHVRQKHTLDILFIEMMQVVFWFNPLFWLLKKSIKLNHEFLADQGALIKCNIAIYQETLFSYSKGTDHPQLESAINYSLTKKRILMLSQTFSRKRAALSALLLIPLLVVCVLLFNNEIKAEHPLPENFSTHPIVGQWVDHANENHSIFIYEKNGTLWFDQQVHKLPIQMIDARYYMIDDMNQKFELSITANGKLQMGDSVYFTKPEDTVSYRIDGLWQTSDGGTSFLFNTKNGQPTCDVTDYASRKTTRYYPKLINDGMVFTVGNTRHAFTFEHGQLFDKNGNSLIRLTNNTVYKSSSTQYDQEWHYVNDFIFGAKRHGKEALVIQIRARSVAVNGNTSSVHTFRRDIDAITRNWEETDYTDDALSIMIKNPDTTFLKQLEEEFQETRYSKANGGMTLIPPPPPAPESPQKVLPPPPPSAKDHLFKMNRLGSLFYFEENLISYKKAQKLVKEIPDISIKTPYPYSTPPKTFLSKSSLESTPQPQQPASDKEIKTYNRLAKKYNAYNGGEIKQGEVALMYDIYSRMTLKQKKRAETYPALPPPPPPTVAKKKNGTKNK